MPGRGIFSASDAIAKLALDALDADEDTKLDWPELESVLTELNRELSEAKAAA